MFHRYAIVDLINVILSKYSINMPDNPIEYEYFKKGYTHHPFNSCKFVDHY